jgi:hypothetical protein
MALLFTEVKYVSPVVEVPLAAAFVHNFLDVSCPVPVAEKTR